MLARACTPLYPSLSAPAIANRFAHHSFPRPLYELQYLPTLKRPGGRAASLAADIPVSALSQRPDSDDDAHQRLLRVLLGTAYYEYCWVLPLPSLAPRCQRNQHVRGDGISHSVGVWDAAAPTRLGSPLPQLHQDGAHPGHVCTGSGYCRARTCR